MHVYVHLSRISFIINYVKHKFKKAKKEYDACKSK